MSIQNNVEALIAIAIEYGWATADDAMYLRNQILAFLGITPYEVEANKIKIASQSTADLLEAFVTWAAEIGRIESAHPDCADYFDTALIDQVLPRPSQIIDLFNKYYEKSPMMAAQWYYDFSQKTQYIRTQRVAKNVIWHQDTAYGEMVFTINLSKPEKDPKAIAAQATVQSEDYPKCLLCYENVGYSGHPGRPARQNHRVIPLSLADEPWFMQYSPYVYYNEHAIIVSKKHVPMAITEKTFERLLDFVDFMPHYFVGSNADLPIVGGSMLSHDHYQAGNYEMPMAKAGVRSTFSMPHNASVTCQWLQWPLTAIRISSEDRQELHRVATKILSGWRTYDDPVLGLKAQEHTITPIARKVGPVYTLDLVLRSCQVSPKYPDGVYHPHQEIHHVKKENIGLIEVMGLAVLPPRLETIAGLLTKGLEDSKAPEDLLGKVDPAFLAMYSALVEEDSHIEPLARVYKAIGEVFVKGLEHCGVMPLTENGDLARHRFVTHLIQRG